MSSVSLSTDHLTISGELSFETAGEIRGALASLVASPAPRVTVDLDGVERFDLSGVQLLYSARVSAARAGKVLVVAPGALAVRLERMLHFAGLPRSDLGLQG